MLEHLNNPEYLHTLLNPLPVYGLGLGLLALIIALVLRSRAARITALSIVFVSSLAAWPTFHYGEAAYDNVLALADSDGGKWLSEHEDRAERVIFVFYALAAVAAAALLAERFAPRAAVPLVIVTALLTTGALASGAYIASAGGRIRHREFRYVPLPENPKPE